MIIRTAIVLIFLLPLGSAANAQSRISECAVKMGECDENKGRPVCGTDDQTYPTRCHLLRVQCSGHQVSLKYRGPCKACKEAREYALRHKSKGPPNFVPNCKADGTYAALQCITNTGCWCSDITGKPIENTSMRIGKPNCRGFTRANRRRSPGRQLNKRTCTQEDRAHFNDNLLKVFRSEYLRVGQQQKQHATEALDPKGPVKLVLDWKFSQLDANGNQMLDKNEFRELKKLVKRAVKPRRCGRAFGKFCDVNADDRLMHMEWNNCLTKDGNNRHATVDYSAASAVINQQSIDTFNSNTNNNHNNRHTLFASPHQTHTSINKNNNHHHIINNNNNQNNNNNNNNNNHNSRDDFESESLGSEDNDESSQHIEFDEDYEETEDDDDSGINLSMLNPRSSTNYSSIYFLNPKPESSTKESEGDSDCWADQAAALEEQNHGGTRFYVPECTPDGRYQRVQCYSSTPYCWCVNEETGKNIPGTSVKDQRPQCDALVQITRTMKGCAEPRKTIFLKELKEFLKTKLLSSSNAGTNVTKWNTEDERVATLSFVFLDKNKNKAWERKEWKVFRELVTNAKNLRKCGKKMPRYCDVNGDKKISLSEWLSCLQAQPNETEPTAKPTQTNETVTSRTSKRVGSNPLEQYLKD